MQTVHLGTSRLSVSRLAYGCWRIAGTWEPSEVTAAGVAAGRTAVISAYEAGYTLFDHADIYCGGRSEEIFGQVLKEVSGMRDRVLIASKCGIRFPDDPTPGAPYRYDFSGDHIQRSCEASLKRLGVDCIDLYQLHRPDYLGDPHEVAGAFAVLLDAGKARHFGVSNCRPSYLAALQRACPFPLVVNQVEISLAQRSALDDGTLDQCLAEQITPMAWSPLGGGQLADGARRVLPSQEGYGNAALAAKLEELAGRHGGSRSNVALAWILRHPSGIVPIIGSTNPGRIKEAIRALDVKLSREEWYDLLVAARGERLP
ncbi:MAG TPA: aldo/keto reductase [Verrucomicrobiales bacterium]|nr:aldo/keto reductase [Verrucomicrobiales bacterium]